MATNKPNERRVSTDALETLGGIHEREEKRDAIHLAVEPVEAGEKLMPGERITVKDGVALSVDTPGEALGIVDPFLPRAVKKGERFWFVMNPRLVHSLRHVWTHPSFPDEPVSTDAKKAAEAWLRVTAERLGVSYSRLLENAGAWVEYGDYWTEGAHFEGESVGDDFWPRYELVTGKAVPEDKRHNFLNCSC